MKKNIVGLMLKTPESIQLQLSDAITFIGKDEIYSLSLSLSNSFIIRLAQISLYE